MSSCIAVLLPVIFCTGMGKWEILLFLVVPIQSIGTEASMRRAVSGTDVKSATSLRIRVVATILRTHKRSLILVRVIIIPIILAARNIDKKRCREH